jgi:hypothetical protein
VVLVFQLRAIDRRRVQEQIGRAGTAVLQEMLAELDKLTGRAEYPVCWRAFASGGFRVSTQQAA